MLGPFGRRARVNLVDGHGRHAWVARHDVLVALRPEDHVAAFEPKRRERPALHPAGASGDQMERRDQLRPRHDPSGEPLGRRGQDRPGPRELGAEVDDAGKPDDAQGFGQDVHRALPFVEPGLIV